MNQQHKNKGEVGKTSYFLALNINMSKTVADSPKLLLMTNMKSDMRFRLTPRSMTLDWMTCYVRVLSEFRGISQIWEATTAKRMKTEPCCQCQGQRCKLLNVGLLFDIFLR